MSAQIEMCRFGHSVEAAVRVDLSEGCICFPEDREQALCAQHYVRMTPLGSVRVIEWLNPVWERHFSEERS